MLTRSFHTPPNRAGRSITRRRLLKGAGASAIALTLPGLTACGPTGGPIALRFFESKREVIDYWTKVTADFNAKEPAFNAVLEQSTNLTADFVRDKPVALGLGNFDLNIAGYVIRGALADLSARPRLNTIKPSMMALGKQFGTYKSDISVVPYSVTGSGVIYNLDLFESAGVAVPTTWTQFKAACETFKSKGITPIQATVADIWTVRQGLFEFACGGMVPDIAGFFDKLKAEGTDVGPDSPVTFQKVFGPACKRILEVAQYFNASARNDNYTQGGAIYAQGKSAMMFQGPWAYSQIVSVNPKMNLGMFPLPMTDNPADTKVSVNLDLVLYIPRTQTDDTRRGGEAMFDFLLDPVVCNAYNTDNYAFGPFVDSPPQTNPKVSGLSPYVLSGRVYQGMWRYVPTAIPIDNYLSQFMIDGNVEAFLGRLDFDWKRLAVRLSA